MTLSLQTFDDPKLTPSSNPNLFHRRTQRKQRMDPTVLFQDMGDTLTAKVCINEHGSWG